jgi:hypothetical protein
MTKQTSRILALVALAGLAVGATGCKSVCRDCCANAEKGGKGLGSLTIRHQPEDQTVKENDKAEFKVDAAGGPLEYQWFFDNGSNRLQLADSRDFNGTRKNKLEVSNVSDNKVGHYYCRIISYDSEENPVSLESRMATLGFIEAPKRPQSLGTVDHQPLPPGSSGTSTCGVYCAFILFDNINHAGYKPATGQTKGYLTLKLSNSTGTAPLQTSTYKVLWKTGVREKGCAADYSTTQKWFSCSAPKAYKFIVYFNCENWPPPNSAGAQLLLDVDFQ